MDTNKNLFAEERRREIVRTVSRESRATVTELADKFGVSQATLRNDLRDLEAANLLRRTHGGAVALEELARERPADAALNENKGAKEAIGRTAAGLVSKGDTLFCDSGSTTLELVRALPPLEGITLITNDIKIALEAESRLTQPNIILLGGRIRNGFHYAMDAGTIASAATLCAPLAFIAASAFSFELGFTVHTGELAMFKRQILERSERAVALLDASKLGAYTTASFATPGDFDALIVDAGISKKARTDFETKAPELNLIIADN